MTSCKRLASLVALAVSIAAPVFAQSTLYDNGPDGDIGYYHANFGSQVANSFELSQPATVTGVTLTLYDVDDRNNPEYLKYTISSEPLGGTVLGSGLVSLTTLQPPYLTRFLYFAWKVSFTIPDLALPAGTYYLQIQDVLTNWDTWAFWAETAGGNSQAYYQAIGQNGAGTVSPVPSETFAVSGQWTTPQSR